MQTGLILIDLQNDYFEGGRYPLPEAEKAAQNAAKLLAHFREKELPIFHVQHISGANAPFFCPDTAGADFYPLTAPTAHEPVFVKHAPDSFYETGLARAVRTAQVTRLVVAGMMTQMCVDTTVRAARSLAFPVVLAQDACAAAALCFDGKEIPAQLVQAAFLAAIDGSFAKVVKTDEWLAEQQ